MLQSTLSLLHLVGLFKAFQRLLVVLSVEVKQTLVEGAISSGKNVPVTLHLTLCILYFC